MTGQDRSAASTRFEYRVIWQREGQAKKRALYQTHEGAKRCVERQALAHDEMDWLPEERRPPKIVLGPLVDVREVGEWR